MTFFERTLNEIILKNIIVIPIELLKKGLEADCMYKKNVDNKNGLAYISLLFFNAELYFNIINKKIVIQNKSPIIPCL